MPIKTVEVNGETYGVLQNGNPVLVDDSGNETAFDVSRAQAKITELIGESRSHKSAKQAAEEALRRFEGIEDPAKALDALRVVQNLDQKKLVDAGDVEAIKAAAIKPLQDQLKAVNDELGGLKGALNKELIGGNFARSQWIAENLTIPGEAAQEMLGRHFSVEDGRVVAKDQNGNTIYTASGEVAGFEDAMPILVNALSYKDSILKGRGQQGSGARPGGGSSAKTISRADFEKMNPAQQRDAISGGATLTD